MVDAETQKTIEVASAEEEVASEEASEPEVIEKLEEAEGSIAADYVYAYPPGIAVITPGEKIDRQVIRDITQMVETGLNMIGVEYQTDGIYIPVTEPVR